MDLSTYLTTITIEKKAKKKNLQAPKKINKETSN